MGMAQMDAVVLREHGGPEVLRREQIDRPEPGPCQVRIEVKAVALNHLDVWVRRGGPAFRLDYPHLLGSEVAGVVDALGPGVSKLEVGARAVVSPGISCGRCAACLGGRDNLCRDYSILGEHRSGGYGQYLVVPQENVAPYPGDLGFAEAAAALLTFQTAWQMLVDKAAVRPGEVVLVHAAGSGVGVAAIQIARLFGARVVATAGGADKLERARELGAEHVIDHRENDFVTELKRLGLRPDVVFEHVGADVFTRSIKAIKAGGRLVTCGATAGFEPKVDLRHVFFRQISILGSTMGSKGTLLEVLEHVAAGRLRPVVDRVMPLAEAAAAHRLIEERRVFGKIVLEP
jgi:NADPH:quinone reductase-like Zn-dependent oxidoreductase